MQSRRNSTREHVYNGLRLGFGAVAGICTMGVLVYGYLKIRFPETDNSLFTFLKAYPPRLVGGICVTVALAILCATVDRWAKMLSGLFGYAVFGGLLAVVAGGFHSNTPSLSLTRLGAGIGTALYAACALLTIRLNKETLNWADRAAALSVPLLLTWGMTSDNAATGFKALSAMVAIFAWAAAYHYLWCRRLSRTD